MRTELGKPLNLDKFKGKSPQRIYRIGIELEGGWSKLPPGTRGLQHDGSVQFVRGLGEPQILSGELTNGPMGMQEWEGWLTSHYPQQINATCGMHVHLSPRTALAYSRLMCPEYPATVIAEFKKWAAREDLPKKHPIWPRLMGKSIYCQHLYMADDQVRNVSKDHNQNRLGHRYTVINYCHGRYGTVECRLLPMMDTPDQARQVVQELIDITNAFLKGTRRAETRHVIDEIGDGKGIEESIQVEIPRNERRYQIVR